MGENAAFEDYTIQFEEAETQRCPVIEADSCLINNQECAYELKGEREIPLRHSLFYNDALVFENLRSRRVKVLNKATGRGVEMDFSQFPLLGICLPRTTALRLPGALDRCATQTTEGDGFWRKGMQLLPPGRRKPTLFLSVSCEGAA